ncbi:MAG: purine-nucleoside phosphorylase [Bernardetiaceae bacterium]|nr:purine-nucleoside phosphorylase [Bernardetiaceae bacterium]
MGFTEIRSAVDYIHAHCSIRPRIGIILGTGLGTLVQEVDVSDVISYEDIPHFPISTVESHLGKLIFGKIAEREVVVMQGRLHYYEGYDMQQVVFPVRVMKLLGVDTLLISNAAGGLNNSFQVSELMLIEDHIDLLPDNPLRGRNIDELGPRFPDMSEAYNPYLLRMAKEISQTHNLAVQQGVYVSVPGPNLETKAEYKYLQIIGADAVGMSTVPEVIAAVHAGLSVFAVSVITDLCFGTHVNKLSLEDVIAAAKRAEPSMTLLFKQMIKRL